MCFPKSDRTTATVFSIHFAFEKAATVSLDVVQRRVCVCGCRALANPPPEQQLVLRVFFFFLLPLFALCSLKQVSQWCQTLMNVVTVGFSGHRV